MKAHAGATAALWYSDFFQNKVYRVTPDGTRTVVLELDDQPSGLGWLPNGDLLVVSMIQRKLVRFDGQSLSDYADLAPFSVFRCNDMVVASDGTAYVGHFGFNHHAGEKPRPASLIRVSPDGEVSVAAPDLMFPNGCVITPDGKTLIAGETMASRYTAFAIEADGTLSGRRTWAEMPGMVPDGCTLDDQGTIWFADPVGNQVVRVREGGEILEKLPTPMGAFACMLGGDDGRDLYVLTRAGFRPGRGRRQGSGSTLGDARGLPSRGPALGNPRGGPKARLRAWNRPGFSAARRSETSGPRPVFVPWNIPTTPAPPRTTPSGWPRTRWGRTACGSWSGSARTWASRRECASSISDAAGPCRASFSLASTASRYGRRTSGSRRPRTSPGSAKPASRTGSSRSHADAGSLPYADGFFDAIVSGRRVSLLRNGGRRGREADPAPPHRRADRDRVPGHDDRERRRAPRRRSRSGSRVRNGHGPCFRGDAWWSRRFERFPDLVVERADSLRDGWKDWIRFCRATIPPADSDFHEVAVRELETIEADAGRTMGFVRTIAHCTP